MPSDPTPIVLLGCGNVGRAFLAAVDGAAAAGASVSVWAIADRSGALRPSDGSSPAPASRAAPADALEASLPPARAGDRRTARGGSTREIAAHKASGGALADLGAGPWIWPSAPFVLVDAAGGDTSSLWREALARGGAVVTANKVPLADPAADFGPWRQAWRRGRLEVGGTVGAGVPSAALLRALLDGGDRVRRIDGVVSGTLHFVVDRVTHGEPLADAVDEAARRGYTEPDPAIDLSGADVGRKLTILGRLAGLWGSPPAVQVEGIAPAAWRGLPPSALRDRLRGLGQDLAQRVRAAEAEGRRLRFVGTADRDGVRCALRDVPADSPLARLDPRENGVVFSTARFDAVPVALTGPGFGPDVTAKTLVADVSAAAARLTGG